MRWREFITLFGGVASLPLIARAQQGFQIHRIGMISASVPLSMWRETTFIREFLGALHDLGHAEGRDLAIEFRSAEGNWERLPTLPPSWSVSRLMCWCQAFVGHRLTRQCGRQIRSQSWWQPVTMIWSKLGLLRALRTPGAMSPGSPR